MGAGWIESIWIGFRFTPWVWYDMHPTGISRVGLFIWLFLKAANIERGKQVQMLIIPDVSIWVWLNHSTMLLHRTLFILPISLMWSSYLSRTGGALFTSWHALQVTANYVCVLHRVCVCVFVVVILQEEQARLWDVSLCQVSPLHLWQALQRRLSTEQEGLLHLHV